MHNEHFDTPFVIDRSHDFYGATIETHFYEYPNLYIELTLNDSYISLIKICFNNELTDRALSTIYSIFELIDADFDKSLFDLELTKILQDPDYFKSVKFDTVRVHLTSLKSNRKTTVYSILYYPLAPN